MPIPLPNLDDRRWASLVEEARSLIPLHAPEWTDHNVHDPGIMLIELLAWIAEMDVYQLNRIPESHRRKFLTLVGIRPNPPKAAQAILSLSTDLGNVSTPILPEGVEFSGVDAAGQQTLFRTLEEISAFPGSLSSLQMKDEIGFQDLLSSLLKQETVYPLGKNPKPGNTLYLGFDMDLHQDFQVSLFFTFADPRSGNEERLKLMEEMRARKEACHPSPPSCDCNQEVASKTDEKSEPQTSAEKIPPHHSVHVVWEYYDELGNWRLLDPQTGQIGDKTRALTLDGPLILRVPSKMGRTQIGLVKSEFYYLRCRFVYGYYDKAPILKSLIVNGVAAGQSVPINEIWEINKNAIVEGNPPSGGDWVSFLAEFDNQRVITKLIILEKNVNLPQFLVLDYQAPSQGMKGKTSIEAEIVGFGNGKPNQQLALSTNPIIEENLRLYTIEENGWRIWHQRPDFHSSGRDDAHFLLDSTNGLITFGDGEKGQTVTKGAAVIAAYSATRAELGNINANAITKLADSPHNKAVLKDNFYLFKQHLNVTNPFPAENGLAAETLDQAAGRVLMESPKRAVTLEDYEKLAIETPGTHIARTIAKANFHPAFPCLKTPGVITLLLLPFLPLDRPRPSLELRQAVEAWMTRRRVVGTRLIITEPTYLEVAVKVKVKSCTGVNRINLQQMIMERLSQFLHPLKGGPDGSGWPLGRDVYRSEIMQIIDETAGVDHVVSLQLIADEGEPQCRNVCIEPCGLVDTGIHNVEVV